MHSPVSIFDFCHIKSENSDAIQNLNTENTHLKLLEACPDSELANYTYTYNELTNVLQLNWCNSLKLIQALEDLIKKNHTLKISCLSPQENV